MIQSKIWANEPVHQLVPVLTTLVIVSCFLHLNLIKLKHNATVLLLLLFFKEMPLYKIFL